MIRAPGRHGSIRATREAALQALAETKARVGQAMEDTVAIRNGDSLDDAPGGLTPGLMPRPFPLQAASFCSPMLIELQRCIPQLGRQFMRA